MNETLHMATDMLPFKIALIGVLGIGAQWLAWRIQRPAIVLMAVAGLIFGPFLTWVLGLPAVQNLPELHEIMAAFRLDPERDFGGLYQPMVGIAVAIILFEGGLSLRFRDLQDAARPVIRMVLIAAPVAALLGAMAAHTLLELSWDISFMIGGLFVVTGPTVILPLLRQSHLPGRAAAVLKWEGIINDPLGALFAVAGFEFIRFTALGESIQFALVRLGIAAMIGAAFGVVSGWLLAWSFRRGMVPEYLKAPVVLIWVLFIYVMANQIAEETGLLAVTAMGVAMANTKFAAMQEMRRFKENIAILLVSGVFVVLSASLNPEVLRGIDLKVLLFVLAMMLVVRPIAVFASTLWSGLNWRETTLVALIAPRGIVAVAVAGLFATELGQIGRVDGAIFVPLAFALVFATVLTSGFIIGPLTRALGLAKDKNEGVMIVGANPWSLGLARALKDMGVPVLVADTNWRRLRGARQEGLDVFYGEVLSENADHRLDHSRFGTLIAATPNDAYNALVCVEFAPELGRHRVFQLAGPDREEDDNRAITYTARGRTLNTKGKTFDMLTRDWWSGWRFKVTGLGEEFGLEDFLRERGGDVLILMARRPDGTLDFQTPERTARSGSVTVLSFGPLAPASKDPEAAQDGGKATAQPA